MKITVTALLALLSLSSFYVHAEEGRHVIGVQGGHVGMTQKVGEDYGSALGYGAFFNYAGSDFLELQLNYLQSKHTRNNLNLDQKVFGISALYIIDQIDAFVPYAKGGAEFISHTQDIENQTTATTASYNSQAFGLLLGAGTQFLIGSNMMAGLDFAYHSVFEATTTVGARNVPTIQSFFTVMLQFGYRFGSGK